MLTPFLYFLVTPQPSFIGKAGKGFGVSFSANRRKTTDLERLMHEKPFPREKNVSFLDIHLFRRRKNMLKFRRIVLCSMLALVLGIGGFIVCTIGSPTTAEAATCSICNGSGKSGFKCQTCLGTGKLQRTGSMCRDCNGTGWKPCGTCKGSGKK